MWRLSMATLYLGTRGEAVTDDDKVGCMERDAGRTNKKEGLNPKLRNVRQMMGVSHRHNGFIALTKRALTRVLRDVT